MSDQQQSAAAGASEDSGLVDRRARYWRKNIVIMTSLLVIWAVAGLGCGVLFSDFLNQFEVGGFPLGFWFAQQGSIVVFVVLILAYAILLERLDRQHTEAARGAVGNENENENEA